MNWLDVFCFISVSRTRSFSVTARELMISQQAVSRHIQNLEKETGLRLFLRNYHEICLTKAGERMLQCLVQRENMERAFKEDLLKQGEELRVAWSQWLGCPDSIRARIRAYCEDHPDVTVLAEELDDAELLPRLAGQRFDLLLTTNLVRNRLELHTLTAVVKEEPMYLLTAARPPASNRISSDTVSSPHIAAAVGNETADELERRIRREYTDLGMDFSQLETAENARSVYINVLLRKGSAFTVSRRMLTQNPRFALRPLDRSATVVLCRPFRPGTERVRELEEYILQRKEVPT